MDIKDINFLTSKKGLLIYTEYEKYSDLELEKLLLKLYEEEIPHFSAVVSLIKLRRKAENKFSKNRDMFFTYIGLEQSTSEKIAIYMAEKFKGMKKVVDLNCGIGGNLIFLAKQAQQTVAVDISDVNLECAKHNAQAYGVAKKIDFRLGDAFDNIVQDADAFFIDPSREIEGRPKTRSIVNSEPNLLKILPKILKVTKNISIKISPAFDYKDIRLLPEEPEIEIISENNVCKVALLNFGKFKTCQRKATCIISDKLYQYNDKVLSKKIEVVSHPLEYLYEPNKAIIKAHLINEVADEFDLKKINFKTSFLTSNDLIKNKKELFRTFKVIYFDKYSVKGIKKKLKEEKIKKANIMTKRFPQKPEYIYDKIKIKEGGDWLLIVTVFADDKYYYILAKRV